MNMKPAVITISRQFGSGGRLIGAELSKRLGIPCYEKTLFEEAARHSNIHQLFFERAEGRNDRIYANTFSCCYSPMDLSLDDRMYIAQAETIRKMVQRGPCIIVGRGANRCAGQRSDPQASREAKRTPEGPVSSRALGRLSVNACDLAMRFFLSLPGGNAGIADSFVPHSKLFLILFLPGKRIRPAGRAGRQPEAWLPPAPSPAPSTDTACEAKTQ